MHCLPLHTYIILDCCCVIYKLTYNIIIFWFVQNMVGWVFKTTASTLSNTNPASLIFPALCPVPFLTDI